MTRASRWAIWGFFTVTLAVFGAVMLETLPGCNCGMNSAIKTEVSSESTNH